MKRLLFILCLFFTGQAQAEGLVVASIKPLHSLVAGVMEGDREPVLLVQGSASPHAFSLKPSQMRQLEQADIVFYMGDSFELFLAPVFKALPDTLHRAPMEKAPRVTLYPLRIDGGFTPDKDERGAHDLHLWLSPANAQAMVDDIARQLSALYPQKKAFYAANAEKLKKKIALLDAGLKKRLAPVKHRPFVVFHDAYQYFEKSYGLNDLGSITLNPERAPGAKHLAAIRSKIKAAGAACVFREPSFDGRIVGNLLTGTNAASGTLDPEGALLQPGPELYFKLMDGLADGLVSCLSSPSRERKDFYSERREDVPAADSHLRE